MHRKINYVTVQREGRQEEGRGVPYKTERYPPKKLKNIGICNELTPAKEKIVKIWCKKLKRNN